jgi:hypothetical protein
MPGATTNLIQLFESASMQYSSLDDDLPWYRQSLEERKICFVSFAENGVKVCVDCINVPCSGFLAPESGHYVDLCFQTVSGQVPRKVMGVFLDQRCANLFHCRLQATEEFHAGNFAALAAALGIDGVEPAQLISMFLLLVLRRDEVAYEGSEEDSDHGIPRHTLPIFEEIQNMLSTV